MIIRMPAPTHRKNNDPNRPLIQDDVWEMTFQYQCNQCLHRWSMAEDDSKPDFCPHCGKRSDA